ncbi:MAG: hypothetical protein HY233_05255 [Acidobacteriales bacterium]|nr:hypothetical protein [Candidatus Koribacter versatilis]MBI3645352.1 hypothetical protein [Terriglobales bacterium]
MFATVDRSSASLARKILSFMKPERVLLLAVLVGGTLAILRSVPLILLPYQIDYGEGLMLEGATRIRHSQPLYPNPFSFPIIVHDWGPVAYAAAALVLPDGEASFPAGRLLVLLSSVLLAFLLSGIQRSCTGSWCTGLSFGLLLLTLPAFRFWLYLLRTDVIGVLLSTIGVMLYVLDGKRWHWSVLFFWLAIFCKYTLIAAPLAVFIHLLLNRKVRQGLGFAAALGSACVLAFLILQIVTGHWFAFHMFSTHSDCYSLVQFFALAALVWASAPVVTALAVWYVAQDFRGSRKSFAPVYFVTSSVTALSAGKLGSTTNHFLECMVASCLCAGLGYSLLMSKHAAKIVPVSALLSVSVLVAVGTQNRSSLQPSRGLAECREAYQFVSSSPSARVLSESLGPLLMARKPILISDPFVYGQALQHGLWPDRKVERLLHGKYFGLVVLANDPVQMKLRGSAVWPESLIDAVQQNYRVVHRFNCRDSAVMLEPVPSSQAHDNSPGSPE